MARTCADSPPLFEELPHGFSPAAVATGARTTREAVGVLD